MHTPGPWYVSNSGDAITLSPLRETINQIIICRGLSPLSAVATVSIQRSRGNARLIEMAPDLLDFIERLAEIDSGHNDIPQWLWDERNRILNHVKGE